MTITLPSRQKRFPSIIQTGTLLFSLTAHKITTRLKMGAANYPYITVVILLFAVCYLKELPDGGKETVHISQHHPDRHSPLLPHSTQDHHKA